jgi:hexulose-6-phosphate isomerase
MSNALERIGFMQGRLSPLVNGRIQAFPWTHWKDEFQLAHDHGLSLMEWTLDHDRLEENPLMTVQGQEEIRALCKRFGISIPSLTGDFLMQKPFFKAMGQERDHLFGIFLKVIKASAAIGIGRIIFPLVDHGRLESRKDQDILQDHLNEASVLLQRNNVQICFEIDLLPEDVDSFLKGLPIDLFAINYDIGNSAALGYDYHQELKIYGKRITNVHVKDRLLHGTTVPLGQGNADISGVIRSLEKEGYKGNYILQTARTPDGGHVEAVCRYRDMVSSYLES